MTTEFQYGLASSMWTLAWVAVGSKYALEITASGSGYYSSVVDVEIASRDAASVVFDTSLVSVG